LSHEFIEHLTASGHFQLTNLLHNINSLDKEFKAGNIKMGIVIPPNFEEDFFKKTPVTIQLITDASEPNYATTLTSYASQMIFSFQKKYSKSTVPPYQIETEIRMMYNPKLIGTYNFIPGVAALILILISAMKTSLTIAKEKETGTMDLLLVSPLPPMLIISGKIMPYVVLSFIDAMLVFAMGYYIFEVPIHGSLPLLLLLSLLYLMVALALGVLISTKAATQQAAMMVSLFTLMLPTMLLSGFMFPISSVPWGLQYISKIVPANYFVQIQQAVMLKGAGWESITHPTLILTIMMFVLFAAAWKNFKVIK
jgi:ABC-2 type transport system permease protein